MPKSMFTARHYKAIAEVIDNSREYSHPETISAHWLIKMLTTMFRLDNPRFDPEAFRIACGEQPPHSD